YYGSWEGWLHDAPPLARALYILKQLKSRQMWAGSVVHEAVEDHLRKVRSGITGMIEPDLLAERVIKDRLRPQFRESKDGLYLQDAKNRTGLLEHHYAQPVSNEMWKALAEDVKKALRNFVENYLGLALDLAEEDWLLLEDLHSFELEDVPVWVKCDFAFRDKQGRVVIVDWKTGKKVPEPGSFQLGCYGLYAVDRWGLDPSDVRVLEINLTIGKEASAVIQKEDLEKTAEEITASIRHLKGLLRDPEINGADSDDFKARPSKRMCHWCSFLEACEEGRACVPLAGGRRLEMLS
ncbi:MAG: PD-(D/E)XK nuclease family protein, partial [Candidatus Eisenbacteria bacterium]|nr:PD-(D/E)XK nuclease family protein [Candidatus Eisenbacteria bacterium]